MTVYSFINFVCLVFMPNLIHLLKSPTTMTDTHNITPISQPNHPATSHPITSLTQAGKQALQELLKYGWIEQSSKPNVYHALLTGQYAVNTALEPLDLQARFDAVRGLVFVQVGAIEEVEGKEFSGLDLDNGNLDNDSNDDSTIQNHTDNIDQYQHGLSSYEKEAQAVDEAWSHPLVRRQRLTLEQSLLLAILRQRYVEAESQHGIGYDDIRIDLEDLQSRIQVYIGSSGSEAKDDARLRTLLEQLANHGVVSKLDDNDEIKIRPLIAHLASPEGLSRLLQQILALKDNL